MKGIEIKYSVYFIYLIFFYFKGFIVFALFCTLVLAATALDTQVDEYVNTPQLKLIDCRNPQCDNILRLLRQPHRLPAFYYRCVEGTAIPLPCDLGTRFNFRSQSCVAPEDWTDSCEE